MPFIVELDGYPESVARLGDSDEVQNAIRALFIRLETRPEDGTHLSRYFPAQVMRTFPSQGFCALRIVYRHVGETVYVFHVHRYDELAYQDGKSERGEN